MIMANVNYQVLERVETCDGEPKDLGVKLPMLGNQPH